MKVYHDMKAFLGNNALNTGDDEICTSAEVHECKHIAAKVIGKVHAIPIWVMKAGRSRFGKECHPRQSDVIVFHKYILNK